MVYPTGVYLCQGGEVFGWLLDAEQYSKVRGYTEKPVKVQPPVARIADRDIVIRYRHIRQVAVVERKERDGPMR